MKKKDRYIDHVIAVQDAWKEGKQIEQSPKGKEEWRDKTAPFDWSVYEYRIKPASTTFRTENRGGARPGSGRKPAAPEKKRIQISISVSPNTKVMIDRLRERGVKVGQVVDELIRQYFEDEE